MATTVDAASKPPGAAPPASTGRLPAVAPPPKLRRRSGLLAGSIALVAVGGLLGAYLYLEVADTSPVLALRQDVARGEVLEADDLVTAQLSGDPALDPVPASQLTDVVGQQAAADLPAGSLLVPGALTAEVIPAPGQSLVPLALPAGRYPAGGLRVGDTVRVVDTPRPADDPPAGVPPATQAVVAGLSGPTDNGELVVDLLVPTGAAAGLAARIATTRVALVVDGTVAGEGTG